MKMLIQIVVVALIVGGMSAAGSYFWHQNSAKKPNVAPSAENNASADSSKKPIDDVVNSDDVPGKVADSPHEESLGPVTVKPSQPQMTFSEALILEPPAGVRPPYIPGSDEAGNLLNKLRSREALTSDRERGLYARQETMELILSDLQFEQDNAAKLRQRMFDTTNQSIQTAVEARKTADSERSALRDQRVDLRRKTDDQFKALRREKELAVKAAEDAVRSARTEREAAEESARQSRSEREELQKQLDDLNKPLENRDLSGEPESNTNLKKLATVFDKLPPENAAKILQEMVKKGRTEGVVVVLDAMTPRISSKVLSTISDENPTLAAELTERLKQFKRK